MPLHATFSFSHFLGLMLLLLIFNLLVLKLKKENFKKLWNWKVFLAAFIFTCLGLLYQETGFSGTFSFRSYGFPGMIFEIYNILPDFEKGATVRVHSKMNWGILWQNLLLFYGTVILIFNLINKRTKASSIKS